VADAQEKFEAEIAASVPPGYRVGWLGMFENLARARVHFAYLIPITVAILFALLLVTFGSIRAAILVLMGIPFACIGGVLALYLRGMHANVSTGVGFCALFGIAIMDGVLMVRGITVLRESGTELRSAIVQGAQERLRPILMTAIVAILGLLPASLATGLGSDVQRPLATVIVWGLCSSTVLTLFVVPVFYYLLAPPLHGTAERAGTEFAARFIEPLPDVAPEDVVALLEHLVTHGGEAEVFQLADRTNTEFARLLALVKTAEMLDFVEAPGHMVVLTERGKAFCAVPADRPALWREQLLRLGLFREIRDVLLHQPGQSIDWDFVLETIITRMPAENYERVFNTFVRWARFGHLFDYNEETQRVTLYQPPP
jgi:hypothetical protein